MWCCRKSKSRVFQNGSETCRNIFRSFVEYDIPTAAATIFRSHLHRTDSVMDNLKVRLKCVLLAGGESSRMRQAKYTLPYIDHRSISNHLLGQLNKAFPSHQGLYISIHRAMIEDFIQPDVLDGVKVTVICDALADDDARRGPAAGLLAAHNADPHAYWVVLACDYPLMMSRELARLCAEFIEPVTCFVNEEGWYEPLIGIWSPAALGLLLENVRTGVTGPLHVVRQLKGKGIKPSTETVLFNTNTPAEWEKAMKLARMREEVTA